MTDFKPFASVADGSNDEVGGLYRYETYTDWSRQLHRRMPLPENSRVLFDSTVEEPLGLLSEILVKGFSPTGTSRYESVFGHGNSHLIQALAQRYGVAAEQLLPTTGVIVGLRQLLAALVKPQERVLVETPGFDVLSGMVTYAGAQVAPLERQFPDFDLTPETLEAAICERTRMVVISNLHNPSGVWIGEERIAALEAVARAHGVWLVVDEVYADIARPVMPKLAVLPNLIRLNSLSKVFGLHGLRCGWIIATADIIARISEANADREFGASKLAHAAAALVLEQPGAFEDHWRTIMARYRPVLNYHLDAMIADGVLEGGMPQYGCMAFPRVVGQPDTVALADVLWRDHGLVTAPGEMFGLSGHMRLGMGASVETMDDGLARLHRALRSV